ncbi:MAG: DDE-type integrase/transposase/recombinase, partial [Oscillospiraceae bacterium]|nr:DDE-type integrase/transposase/recombinase [Oscillospiraceae bacterium]
MGHHLKSIHNPYFRNRLDQQYDQTAPNPVWVSDITYVKVGERYYFVCVILDLFSRLVLSYGISDTIDTTMVVQTFLSAFSKRNRP